MPTEGVTGDYAAFEVESQRTTDVAKLRLIFGAMPNGVQHLDPLEYIIDSAVISVGAPTMDYLITDNADTGDEDGPNADMSQTTSSNSSTNIS